MEKKLFNELIESIREVKHKIVRKKYKACIKKMKAKK